jgi:hypothetical protein
MPFYLTHTIPYWEPRAEAYFFEVLEDFLGKYLERLLLILAALFLWMIFFLAARSAREMASLTFSLEPSLANLIATSSLVLISLLVSSFLFEDLNALLAVLVTGIINN